MAAAQCLNPDQAGVRGLQLGWRLKAAAAAGADSMWEGPCCIELLVDSP